MLSTILLRWSAVALGGIVLPEPGGFLGSACLALFEPANLWQPRRFW